MTTSPPVTYQILALLRAEGRPTTMSQIAKKLARNPGGIRTRLDRMLRTGRIVETDGPDGWKLYSYPVSTK